MSSDVFTLHRGSTPLLVSVPHAGTSIPDEVRDRFVERAADVEDSDWHLDRLYAFVREMGAGLIVPIYSRYLIDLNLGTANAESCAPSLRAALAGVLGQQRAFTHVVDGRFKGGYITRHYGRPRQRQHAVQLEMCFACYMDEHPPFAYDDSRAQRLWPVLAKLVETMIAWRPRDGE